MPKGQAIKYTPEQLDYIKSNCNLGRKELTLKANLKFNTNFSVDSIKSLCTRNKWNTGRTGCFEKETSHGIRAPRVFANLTQEALKKVVIAGI